MALPVQSAPVEIGEDEWREETLRNAYNGILDGEAFRYEAARLRSLQELRERKLEEQRRREEWNAFLQHPGWIAVPLLMIFVYSHFTLGIKMLPAVVFQQVILLQPPNDFTHVPITLGLLITAWLFWKSARRSLKESIPALALLFDLCCGGLIVASAPRLLQWIYSQLLLLWSQTSFESICSHFGLNPTHVQWIMYTLLVVILYVKLYVNS